MTYTQPLLYKHIILDFLPYICQRQFLNCSTTTRITENLNSCRASFSVRKTGQVCTANDFIHINTICHVRKTHVNNQNSNLFKISHMLWNVTDLLRLLGETINQTINTSLRDISGFSVKYCNRRFGSIVGTAFAWLFTYKLET